MQKSRNSRHSTDRYFKWIATAGALTLVAIMAGLFIQLVLNALPAFEIFGFEFFTSTEWNPAQEQFGALPAIRGTLLTTFIAILIGVPSSFFIAFLLTELLPSCIAKPIGHAVDLLAAIPSIIFGMWAFMVLIPLMQQYVQPALQTSIPIHLGEKPCYHQTEKGVHLSGNKGYMQTPHIYYLDFEQTMTLALRFTPQITSSAQSIYYKGEAGIQLSITPSGHLNFNGAISETKIEHNVTQTLIASIENNTPRLWINTQETLLNTALFQMPQNTTSPLWIGKNKDGNYLKGNLEWLRFYNSSLTPNEIDDTLFQTTEAAEDAIDEHRLEVAWEFSGENQDNCIDLASSLPLSFNTKKIELNFLKESLFAGDLTGSGTLSAGLILAFMILPFITSVMRDIFIMTPPVIKESAYGMGATPWETTLHITLPYGMQGFLGAIFLGLGRALGETMAVLFIIGNAPYAGSSLFAPATTIASTLANSFGEADGIFKNVLFALGLILLFLSFGIQIIAQRWLNNVKKQNGGGL